MVGGPERRLKRAGGGGRGQSKRHEGIIQTKDASLNRVRTLEEWSSILHFHSFCADRKRASFDGQRKRESEVVKKEVSFCAGLKARLTANICPLF